MKKFIITEDERKHIKGLYEQTTTNGEQQTIIPNYSEFITLYNNGFNKLNTEYQGKWNQGFFIFGNYKIDRTTSPYFRSETPIKLKLELAPTQQSELMDSGMIQFTDNGDFVKKHRTYNFNVYDNTNKKIDTFKPQGGDIKNFIFDSNGNKVDWNTYVNGIKQFKKQ